MSDRNGLDPQTKALTSTIGAALKELSTEVKGRDRLLLDRLELVRKGFDETRALLSRYENVESLMDLLKSQVSDQTGSIDWLRTLIENRPPPSVYNEVKTPEVRVEVKSADVRPPDVVVKGGDVVNHNNIETPQVFVDVDMTPVAKAIERAFDKMVDVIEVLSRAVAELTAKSEGLHKEQERKPRRLRLEHADGTITTVSEDAVE